MAPLVALAKEFTGSEWVWQGVATFLSLASRRSSDTASLLDSLLI